jgi:hypothetical protein
MYLKYVCTTLGKQLIRRTSGRCTPVRRTVGAKPGTRDNAGLEYRGYRPELEY